MKNRVWCVPLLAAAVVVGKRGRGGCGGDFWGVRLPVPPVEIKCLFFFWKDAGEKKQEGVDV